jgi:DNA-binding transcriptional regulator YiaG
LNISSQLKRWRTAAKLSQSQAAARLLITTRTLQNWEQGVAEPRGLARTALLQAIKEKGKQ